MKYFQLKLVLAIFICLGVGIGTVLWLVDRSYRDNIHHLAEQAIQQAAAGFAAIEKQEINKLFATLHGLLGNEALQQAFLARDRAALLQLARPLFNDLKQDYGITHWYFHHPQPAQTNFLRVHNPSKHGDTINRITYRLAMQGQHMGAGKELGRTAFALRAVHPYHQGEQRIGYMELGQEIDEFLHLLKTQTGNDYAMVVLKEHLDAAAWAEVAQAHGQRNNWADYPEVVVLNSTSNDIHLHDFSWHTAELPEHGRLLGMRRHDGRLYAHGVFPVYDAAGTKVGGVVLRHDMTPLAHLQNETRRNVLFSGGGVAVATLVVFMVLLRRFIAGPLGRIEALGGMMEQMGKGQFGFEYDWESDKQQQDRLSRAVGKITLSVQRLKTALQTLTGQIRDIAGGDYSARIALLSPQDELGQALNDMVQQLRTSTAQNALQDWMKSGHAQLSREMSGEQALTALAENILNFLTPYVQAQSGVFYTVSDYDAESRAGRLKLVASYAYSRRKHLNHEFAFGEGLVGQAAREKKLIILETVPADYLPVQSGLGEATPRNVLVMPFLYEDSLKGIIELAALQAFSETQVAFLKQAMPAIAIAVNTTESRARMQELLAQTRAQTEELQSQSEELQVQQEELRQSNDELTARSQLLEQQKVEIGEKNLSLEKAREAMELKAKELEITGKYKSEFLANMSHELRTPLNSLLILAQLLAGNKDGNLTAKQIEQAQTIHNAGKDLLTLINDILDLSKVEAGKLEVHVEPLPLTTLAEEIQQRFQPLAEGKGLKFVTELGADLPPVLFSDGQRLKQVLTNLLSNAIKFTAQGEVRLHIHRPAADDLSGLDLEAAHSLAFSVIDSGIGIAPDKQQVIFEAFQQADGTTSRKYGGTGLGLSISRQLSRLLGGDIRLRSEEGRGSAFSLYLPEKWEVAGSPPLEKGGQGGFSKPESYPLEKEKTDSPLGKRGGRGDFQNSGVENPPQPPFSKGGRTENPPQPPVDDDRTFLKPGEKCLLIIDDDPKFSQILLETGREQGYKCLVAGDGRDGLRMAEEYTPDAIILDVGLPLVDGLTVMDTLKQNLATRHIPIQVISAGEHGREARRLGALGYSLKPVNMGQLTEAFEKLAHFGAGEMRNLLILAAETRRDALQTLLAGEGVDIAFAADVAQAEQLLTRQNFDCAVLDMASGAEAALGLLEPLRNHPLPVIFYAEHPLSEAEEKRLHDWQGEAPLKTVASPERLVDEVTLFLHQVETHLPEDKRQMLRQVHDKEAILKDRKILLVDDDMRNIYALSAMLESKGMEVFIATDGRKALDMLDKETDIALVLMDIMMPELDGYATMRQIRSQTRFRKLPIIALTAKAMQGDKRKCLEAGANDYLAKPVDNDKLLSLLRVWLYR